MNDLMVQVLVVAILANIVLVVVAVIRSYVMRSRRERAVAAPVAVAAPDVDVSGSRTAAADGLAPPTAWATEADVLAGSIADMPDDTAADMPDEEPDITSPIEPESGPWPGQGPGPETEAAPEEVTEPASETTEEATMSAQSEEAMPREDAVATALFDDETGLRGPVAWEEALGHEDSRVARYGRQVTIVVVELDRLDALARQLGRDNADRLIRPVAQALHGNARAADIVARLGHHRFGILLPETDEIRAINYVERVRHACDSWLDAAAVSVRMAIGWASVPSGGDLGAAFKTAERRMYAERSGGRSADEGAVATDAHESPADAPEPAPGDVPEPYSDWTEPAADQGL